MLGSKNGRVLVAGGLLSGILALGILACAGTPEPHEVTVDVTGTIEDIVVDSSGNGSRLTFLGPDRPIFTAFQQTDPDRLIIDLAGVGSELASEPITVTDGTIEQISVAPFPTGSGEPMTRIEITLTGEVDYRTPIAESEQFFHALKLRKIDTVMVRIPEASHGIAARPSHLIAKVAHILKWFERYGGPAGQSDE